MSDKPLTVKEAAEFLSVTSRQVREYLARKQLKGHRIGNGTNKKGSRRHWRIWKDDLMEFTNRNSNIKE